MRVIVLLFTLLLTNDLMGQRILLFDKENNTAVVNVNISNNIKGTTSDVNGFADLNVFEKDDEILIQHVSYIPIKELKSKIKDTVFLVQNKYVLNTINFEEVKTTIITGLNPLSAIKRKEIERLKNRSMGELLKQSIGIHVQESQSGGGSPNFRGMEANRLLVILDGIALNNAIYRSGHVQSSNIINSFFVDKINVVTGPSSVVYGDGAMGGALKINTLNKSSFGDVSNIIEQKLETSSSSSSVKYISKLNSGKLNYINAMSVEKHGNMKMGKQRYHGYDEWGNEDIITNGNEQLETSYEKYDVLQKTNFNYSKNLKIGLNSQYSYMSNISRFDKLNDYSGNQRKYIKWEYGPQERINQIITLTKKTRSNFFDNFSVIGSWQKTNESRHKQKTNDSIVSNRYEKVIVYDAILDFKKDIKGLNLNYGASYRKQYVNSRANLENENGQEFFNTTRYPDAGSEVDDGSLYFQAKIKPFKNTTLFLGERYNTNILRARFTSNPVINLPFSEITTNNSSLVSSILISQNINKNLSVGASYYMGFRNPNVDDVGKIFSKNDYSVIVPNNELRPEKTNNFEYGIMYLNKRISFEIQFFNTNIKDAIQRTYSTLNGLDSIIYDGEIMRVQMNQNIESAKINGVNVGMSIINLNNFFLDLKYNYLTGKNDLDRPLAHIPPSNLKIQFSRRLKKFEVGVSYFYNSWKKSEDYDDNGVDNLDEATIDGTPSWQILNLDYRLNINENLVASFSLENIFDAHYKTFGSGISASGRNFVVSLTSKF